MSLLFNYFNVAVGVGETKHQAESSPDSNSDARKQIASELLAHDASHRPQQPTHVAVEMGETKAKDDGVRRG